jgi:hypothetical protein
LHLGWVKQLPGAEHALLQGPLLFLVNNGKFTEDDARAINSMSSATKPAIDSQLANLALG